MSTVILLVTILCGTDLAALSVSTLTRKENNDAALPEMERLGIK